MSNELTGCRVLIVEDEWFLADNLRVALKSLGANVIALVGDLDEALDLLAHGGFDVAVIDINPRGDLTFTIADQLQRRGIPFVFSNRLQRRPDPGSIRRRDPMGETFRTTSGAQRPSRTLASRAAVKKGPALEAHVCPRQLPP